MDFGLPYFEIGTQRSGTQNEKLRKEGEQKIHNNLKRNLKIPEKIKILGQKNSAISNQANSQYKFRKKVDSFGKSPI